jgi:hypothetical protein
MERIMTLGDLAGVSDERAKALLGARGPSFVRWARGEDDRPIDRSQPPRSIAREVTLTHADAPESELSEVVRHLADVLAMRLRSMGWFARTVTLRLASSRSGVRASGSASTSDRARQPNRLVRSVTLREATALDEDLARGRGVAAEGAVAAAAGRRPRPRALEPAADGSADAAVPARPAGARGHRGHAAGAIGSSRAGRSALRLRGGLPGTVRRPHAVAAEGAAAPTAGARTPARGRRRRRRSAAAAAEQADGSR